MKNPIPIFLNDTHSDESGLQRLVREASTLRIESPNYQPGPMVITYDPGTNDLVFGTAVEVMVPNRYHGVSVELSTGRELLLNPNHNTLLGIDVDDPELRPLYYETEDAGDRRIVVPFVKDLGQFLSNEPRLSEVTISENPECPFHTMDLDFDLGWVLGALIGNGWWDKQDRDFYTNGNWLGARNIYLADHGEECAARMRQFFHEGMCQEGVAPSYTRREQKKSDHPSRYGDSVKHTFMFPHCDQYCDFLTEHLGGERDESTSGSANKHLPGFFMSAPQEFQIGLLCGLVDTDGSCSVSKAKEKSQLICQYSTTSLRLGYEILLLCRMLGIEATITRSKETIAGNTLWLVGMSAADCKRLDIFRKLANSRKCNTFLETEVSQSNVSLKFNRVVFPKVIGDRLMKDLTCPKITKEMREQSVPDLEHKKYLQNIYQQVHKGLKDGIASREATRKALEEIQKSTAKRKQIVREAMEILRESILAGCFTPDSSQVNLIKEALDAMVPKQDTQARIELRNQLKNKVNHWARSQIVSHHDCRQILHWIEATPMYEDATLDPDIIHWREVFLENKGISWARVKGVTDVSGEDLPVRIPYVPGSNNYMDVNGVFIGNTINTALEISVA